MLLLLQIALYCLLYILLVKLAVKNDGLNCLYFYPKEYIDEAQKRGKRCPPSAPLPQCFILLLRQRRQVLWC